MLALPEGEPESRHLHTIGVLSMVVHFGSIAGALLRRRRGACAGLARRLAAGHPEAGPHYWASRSWSMPAWQPAYLCVLSVHLAGALPALEGLRQDRMGGTTGGLRLPMHAPLVGAAPALIEAAGRMLQAHWPRWLAALARHRPYPRTLAACLLADCLNAALLMLPHARAGGSEARVRETSTRWLAASGLAGRSGLLAVATEDGRTALDLDRRACCQHFRRADGAPCSTCPRLSRDRRRALLRERPACTV